jgi:hypothetical protein
VTEVTPGRGHGALRGQDRIRGHGKIWPGQGPPVPRGRPVDHGGRRPGETPAPPDAAPLGPNPPNPGPPRPGPRPPRPHAGPMARRPRTRRQGPGRGPEAGPCGA